MKFLLFALSLTILTSCSKNNNSTSTQDTCNKIVEVLEQQNYTYQTTATLTFDGQGRVKTVLGQGQNKTDYTYYNDSIVIKATDIYGVDITSVLYLDNLHRVIKTKFSNPEYTYNNEGYLISYKQAYGNNGQIFGYTQYFLTWQNGNLTLLYTNDANASMKKVTFQYYNLPNQNLLGYNSPFFIGDILYDRNSFFLLEGLFFGKQSKDLLKSVNFNDTNQSSDIGYSSDSTGRIINSGSYYKFKYQCP